MFIDFCLGKIYLFICAPDCFEFERGIVFNDALNILNISRIERWCIFLKDKHNENNKSFFC